MYADDLLLMGKAEQGEMQRIHLILDQFCQLSGQKISREKSKLWFSKVTTLAQIRSALRIFGAKFADTSEAYLGGPVDVSRPAAFKPLLQKVDNKLHAWKARLLSPAGKIILIKSVMEVLAIYHMSTTAIHKSVLDQIQSKCVQFFWGKPGKKSICFVRWSKLTAPRSEGGLGIRCLHMLNRAMVLKAMWKLISGHDALWVQLVAEKYHQSTSFWCARYPQKCTRLWRAILENRCVMANYTRWLLGDGLTCPAYGQPWFNDWETLEAPRRAQTRIKVATLFDVNTQSWNRTKLIQFGGNNVSNSIIAELSGVVLRPGVNDKIVFTWATNGEFTVKSAYKMLDQLNNFIRPVVTKEEKGIWKKIWKSSGVPPRVRMFF